MTTQAATVAQLRARFGVYTAQPGSVPLFEFHKDLARRIGNLTVRPDDIWILSYPESGCGLTGEIAYLVANDFDFEKAKIPMHIRAPGIENSSLAWHLTKDAEIQAEMGGDIIKKIEEMPSPRVIKTHLPIQFLPLQIWTVKPHMLYAIRSPKDTAISYHQVFEAVSPGTLSFQDMCSIITDGDMLYGSQCKHILGFWEERHKLNINFISFEQMIKDPKSIAKDILKVLGKTGSKEQLEKLNDFVISSASDPCGTLLPVLTAIKEKARLNNKHQQEENSVKTNQSYDWKNYINQEISDKFDSWIIKSFKNSDFRFDKWF